MRERAEVKFQHDVIDRVEHEREAIHDDCEGRC